MPMHDVERTGEETPFAPLDFVLPWTFAKQGMAIATQTDENLLEEILARRESFARGNFEDHSVHVHVAGEIQIHAAAFDLGPRLDFLSGYIVNGIRVVNLRDLCVLGPVTIKVTLDASAATDIGGTVDGIFLLGAGWSSRFGFL